MAAVAKQAENEVVERRAPRERAFLQATISFANGVVSFSCIVTQISGTGVKIAVSDEMTVPNRFDISIPQRGIDRSARMVWRRNGHVAAAFINEEKDDAPAWEKSLKRLRELEAENARMRETILGLTSRLSRLTDGY